MKAFWTCRLSSDHRLGGEGSENHRIDQLLYQIVEKYYPVFTIDQAAQDRELLS